jgi:hypothetical protein
VNEQLASFFSSQGMLLLILSISSVILGAVFLDAKKLWPAIVLAIGIILTIGAFVLWSLAIFYNTIA